MVAFAALLLLLLTPADDGPVMALNRTETVLLVFGVLAGLAAAVASFAERWKPKSVANITDSSPPLALKVVFATPLVC
jgi:hypothetical protein